MSVVLKIFETCFISKGKKIAAIMVFYILPPLAQSFLMYGFSVMPSANGFWVTTIAYLLSLTLAIATALCLDRAVARLLYHIHLPTSWAEAKTEFFAATVFFANGTILSAAEQLPTILLRSYGLTYHIPAFELVRKVISVPSLIVHAFGMQFSPDLISHAQRNERYQFFKTLKSYFGASAFFGGAYILSIAAVATLFTGQIGPFKGIDLQEYWPLLLSALVTTLFAPIGAALIAIKGDTWWIVGATSGLAALLLISHFGHTHYGQLAIAFAILIDNLVLSCCIAVGVWTGVRNTVLLQGLDVLRDKSVRTC
jgi:hypothetical protein